MTLTDQFLADIDRESVRTRAVLEKVPTGHDDFKPHATSMPFGRLAGLVASMPSWVSLIVEQDELDLTPPPGSGTYQQPKTEQLVETHDGFVSKGKAALEKRNDQYLLTTSWRLKAGGHVVMEQPRYIVLRDTLSHLAHHRGQLMVYLRMLEQPVPAVYGPSADDKTFR